MLNSSTGRISLTTQPWRSQNKAKRVMRMLVCSQNNVTKTNKLIVKLNERRGQDSNLRALSDGLFSRQVPSTTRPPLPDCADGATNATGLVPLIGPYAIVGWSSSTQKYNPLVSIRQCENLRAGSNPEMSIRNLVMSARNLPVCASATDMVYVTAGCAEAQL